MFCGLKFSCDVCDVEFNVILHPTFRLLFQARFIRVTLHQVRDTNRNKDKCNKTLWPAPP